MTDDGAAVGLDEWTETWFGSPDSWPPALVAASRRCLALTVPATLAWGPDFRLLYNRAYAELLEHQHPAVRGRPAWEPAAAMWPVIGPLLHHVRSTGEAQHGDRAALERDTPDGRRTHWYSWVYSPIWSGGEVEGVFAVVRDDTADELAAGHARAVSAAAQASTAGDTTSRLREVARVVGTLPDVRYVACHLLDPDGRWRRVAHAGPALRGPSAASVLDHAERTGRWPTEAAPEHTTPAVVRAPEAGSRGVWDSWTATAAVGGDVVAVTVGFDPMVGDPGTHRPFVRHVVDAITTAPRPGAGESGRDASRGSVADQDGADG